MLDLANIADAALLLPPEAADKLYELRRNRDDSRSIMRGLVENGMDARQARQDAETRLRSLTQTSRPLPADHPSVAAAQVAFDAASAELARLQQHEQVIGATFASRDRLCVAIERKLREIASGGRLFSPAVAPEVRLQKGETLLDAIERIGRQGRTIAADLHTIASAPVPSTDAKRRMREQVEALAEIGRPNVSTLIEDRAGRVEFAEVSRQTLAHTKEAPFIGWQEPDAVALTVWLHKDALIARLDAEITEEADDKAALSDSARAAKTKELQGDAAMVARQLAALMWQARENNLPVEFDEDADPLAVLGIVAVEMPKQVTVERADEIAVRTRDAANKASAAPFEPAVHPDMDAAT